MLRQIALDTETTGKSDDGTPGDHRIIEVGCVEIVDRRLTGRTLRYLINPQRPVDAEAFSVHGISNEMLQDKPLFAQIAPALIDFIRGAELLIHNAKFDTAFLDKEWGLLGLKEKTADLCRIVDTVALARQINPNNMANLDNLCKIYEIDNSRRTVHGALLDAQLLAEVYLAMTGGQSSFDFDDGTASVITKRWQRPKGAKLKIMSVEPERLAVHTAKTIELSQCCKIKEDGNGGFIAGSWWGPEFDMPYLEKGKEEGKKDYAKRLKAQYEQKLDTMLDDNLKALLKSAQEADARAQADFEARVQHRS